MFEIFFFANVFAVTVRKNTFFKYSRILDHTIKRVLVLSINKAPLQENETAFI